MKLLLDTHTLIWWFNDDPRLGPRARTAIADTGNNVVVSVISFWEIAIKRRIGKLDESGAELMREARASGFEILAIEPEHLATFEAQQPLPDHKDPFDLMILAHARAERATLITSDRNMRSYGLQCM